MLGEDPELLEVIVGNDDNLTYGSIISVYTDPDETTTALTDYGIDEIRDACTTTQTWHQFLDNFVDDPDLFARAKNQPPR